MATLREVLPKKMITQAESATLLEVSQAPVSYLMREKIGLFSIDPPVDMLAQLAWSRLRTTVLAK